jgi:nitrogen regulatory protein P-II 1
MSNRYSRTEVYEDAMMKVEAVIHPFKLDEVRAALDHLGCERLTTSEVLLSGGRNPQKRRYRGCEYSVEVPKVKLEMVVSASDVEKVVEVLSRATCTGADDDDGTILVYEVPNAIRIRSGHHLEFSLS